MSLSPFNIFMTDFTVARKNPGHLVLGKWVEGEEVSFVIKGDLQPVQPNEMQVLPEGRRIDDAQTLYTETPLKSIDGDKNPDIVLIGNSRYEVIKVYDWRGILGHFKVIICRAEQGL